MKHYLRDCKKLIENFRKSHDRAKRASDKHSSSNIAAVNVA